MLTGFATTLLLHDVGSTSTLPSGECVYLGLNRKFLPPSRDDDGLMTPTTLLPLFNQRSGTNSAARVFKQDLTENISTYDFCFSETISLGDVTKGTESPLILSQ